MARIPILQESDPTLSLAAREFLETAKQSRGRLLNIYRAMANRPAAAMAFNTLIATVYRAGSTLEPRHGELAYLTATAVNDCFY